MASDPASAVVPVRAARLLAALVDTLIPGDEGWPAANVVGVQADLATRLVQERGEDALEQVLDTLNAEASALLSSDEPSRVAAIAAWEARDPALFGWVRDAVYLTYYESPVVVQAINAHGHRYKLIPHVDGYRLPPFDAARDTPRHGRGVWIPTGEVRRVAIDTLDLAGGRAGDRKGTP